MYTVRTNCQTASYSQPKGCIEEKPTEGAGTEHGPSKASAVRMTAASQKQVPARDSQDNSRRQAEYNKTNIKASDRRYTGPAHYIPNASYMTSTKGGVIPTVLARCYSHNGFHNIKLHTLVPLPRTWHSAHPSTVSTAKGFGPGISITLPTYSK